MLPTNPTWREQPFNGDLNWLFNYHALRWVLPLLQAGRDTGDPAYTDSGRVPAEGLARDQSAVQHRAPPMAWNDMADRAGGRPSWPARWAISGGRPGS